jgi:hypothetical protein
MITDYAVPARTVAIEHDAHELARTLKLFKER